MSIEAFKGVNHITWCVGMGSCAASFILTSMPYLQYVAVVLSILAAGKSLFGDKLKRLWKKWARTHRRS